MACTRQCTTAGADRRRLADTGAGEDMKRIRTDRTKIRRERPWLEELPADPRDPDVVRAKALARARPAAGSAEADRVPEHDR
jgi:hypothetical protein